MERRVIFVHGRSPKTLDRKEKQWRKDLLPVLGGDDPLALEFASYSDLAYEKRFRGLRPVWLVYDLLRWFVPFWGRHGRRMRLAQPLRNILSPIVDGDVLIISHSFGSLLAYQHLLETPYPTLRIWLVTVGSPLSWVPWPFRGVKRQAPPNPAVKRWANMYHHADPVAGTKLMFFYRDHIIADKYRAENEFSSDQPVDWAIYHLEANPHESNGYLTSRSVRNIVRAFANKEPWPFDAITQEFDADRKVHLGWFRRILHPEQD